MLEKLRAVVLVAAVTGGLLACSGPDDDTDRDGSGTTTTTTVADGATGAPATVPPASTEPIDEADRAAAEQDVADLGIVAGQPPEVVDCVVAGVATDADLAAAVAAADETDPDTLAPLAEAVSRCTQEVVLAPDFAEEQQRAAGGALTDTELACLRDGYAALSADDVRAATDAALNPAAAPAAAMAPIEEILDACGVAR